MSTAGPAAAIGLRALRGGAVAVAVTAAQGRPSLILSTVLATCSDDDRLALEPCTIAANMERGPDGGASAEAIAAVAEVPDSKTDARRWG